MQKILLHICCGVCASSVVKKLREEDFDVVGFFYTAYGLFLQGKQGEAARYLRPAAGYLKKMDPDERRLYGTIKKKMAKRKPKPRR